jgi:hypothetical protein
MDRCNDLCTQDATGTCALCEALAERDRFLRFWFQGGLFVDSVHAMQRRGVFALLHRYAVPLALLLVIGLMLWLAWFIPRSIAWRSTFSRFSNTPPPPLMVTMTPFGDIAPRSTGMGIVQRYIEFLH